MHRSHTALDRELDEALEMTFPASDPVAVAAPGSASPKAESRQKRDESTGEPPKRDRPRSDRRKR